MFFVKKLIISGRTKPMWTVTDMSGNAVFSERRDYGLVQQAWSTKRDAQKIADHCKSIGVEAVKEKLKNNA